MNKLEQTIAELSEKLENALEIGDRPANSITAMEYAQEKGLMVATARSRLYAATERGLCERVERGHLIYFVFPESEEGQSK